MINRKIQLRIALPVFFAVLVSVTAVLIFLVNYIFSLSSMNKMSQKYIGNVGALVLEKTLNHLAPAFKLAAMDTDLLDPQRKNGNYAANFNRVTMKQLAIYPQVTQIYYADTKGNFRMSTREKDGSVASQVITRFKDDVAARKTVATALKAPKETAEEQADLVKLVSPIISTIVTKRDLDGNALGSERVAGSAYDPRLRPWFVAASENKATVWTPAYLFSSSGKHYASGKLGISASSPIAGTGMFADTVGVIGVDITLQELSNFIGSLTIGNTGRAFIVNSTGQIIALNNYKDLIVNDEHGVARLATITQIQDSAVVQSFRLLSKAENDPSRILNFTNSQFTSFTSEGVSYIGYFLPIPKELGLDWYIGIVVPEDDFIGDIRHNLELSILISSLALIIVFLLSVRLSRGITKPLAILTREALSIREFRVEEPLVMRTYFRELHEMATAFDSMKTGLRSFRKFVPADLVRTLIQSGVEASLGGRRENVTVYFSDIVGFTSISEKMRAEELITHLGEYISTQSNLVQNRQGTVDKYIGDAVMAFWNAPVPVEQHALRACEAALDVQDKLKEQRVLWQQQGLPLFYARIGIETGDVVVGNMGSAQRLNYTVIGDTVNQASRLESLGKFYKVSILIGEVAYGQASAGIEARLLDKVILMGKSKAIYVYELLARKGELGEAAGRLKAHYEAGMTAYFSRRWQEARELFEQAQNLDPTDHATVMMLERCDAFMVNPPAEDWNGAFVPESK